MSGLEYNTVVQPLLRYLNALPNAKFINIHGGIYTERGTPDVLGSINGRLVAFECKKDQRRGPEAIQKRRILEWRAAGAVADWVSSVDQAIEIIKKEGLI